MFSSGFGGSFAEANRRASPVGSCCPGCDPADEVGNELLDSWSRGVLEWHRKYEIRTSKDGVSLDAIRTGVVVQPRWLASLSPLLVDQPYRKSPGVPGYESRVRRLWSFIEDRDSAGGRQGPRGLDQRVSLGW